MQAFCNQKPKCCFRNSTCDAGIVLPVALAAMNMPENEELIDSFTIRPLVEETLRVEQLSMYEKLCVAFSWLKSSSAATFVYQKQ